MTHQAREKRNRRRGLLLAILLHTVVVGALLYPFLNGANSTSNTYDTVVLMDFSQSAAAASALKRERNPVKKEFTERAAAPKKPAPPALPEKPATPVITAPEAEPIAVESPEPPKPVAEPEFKADPTPRPVEVPKPSPDPGTVASTVEGTGDANGAGTDTGSPEVGDGDTVADEGDGLSPIGSALEGDGVLVRRVIYRPDLDDVVLQNGTVALNICINQRGRVIGVKWNEERSTIEDTDLVRKAIKKAQQYRFAKDYSAPRRECGVLSIHVKGL